MNQVHVWFRFPTIRLNHGEPTGSRANSHINSHRPELALIAAIARPLPATGRPPQRIPFRHSQRLVADERLNPVDVYATRDEPRRCIAEFIKSTSGETEEVDEATAGANFFQARAG
jgi:hypothetical protein